MSQPISGSSYFPPPNNASPLVAFLVTSPFYLYHPPPTSSPVMVRCFPELRPWPPPDSLRCSSLRPATRAWFSRHVPHPFAPLFRPWPAPMFLLVPGGSYVVGPSVSFVSPHLPPRIFMFVGICYLPFWLILWSFIHIFLLFLLNFLSLVLVLPIKYKLDIIFECISHGLPGYLVNILSNLSLNPW